MHAGDPGAAAERRQRDGVTLRSAATHGTALVTGGAGFIGSHLSDALVARGDASSSSTTSARAASRTSSTCSTRDGVEFVEGSIADAELVDELDGARPTAACTWRPRSASSSIVDQPARLAAQQRARHRHRAVAPRRATAGALLFTSTSEVYGKNSTGALPEDSDRILGSPFKSRWAYAIAKGFGEALAHALHRERGAEIVVVRLFNTVGPRQTGAYGMVLPRFVRQALAGEDLTVYGNGTQTRCFAHVHDTVQAILLLLDDDERRRATCSTSARTTRSPIIELARRVIERTGSGSTIRLVPYEEAYGEGFEELGRRKPDTTALRELTGWAPTAHDRRRDRRRDPARAEPGARTRSRTRLPLEARLLMGLALALGGRLLRRRRSRSASPTGFEFYDQPGRLQGPRARRRRTSAAPRSSPASLPSLLLLGADWRAHAAAARRRRSCCGRSGRSTTAAPSRPWLRVVVEVAPGGGAVGVGPRLGPRGSAPASTSR